MKKWSIILDTLMSKVIRKAVIPAAGLGTRGLPFTKEIPKEMLPIVDIPTIQFIVEEVITAGIEQIIFVTSRGKHSLQDYFDPSPALDSFLRKRGKSELADKLQHVANLCEVLTVRQKEPLGLGHAVLCAQPIIGSENFVVCLGDEIFPPWDEVNKSLPPVKQLVQAAHQLGSSVIGVMEVAKSETRSYGMIDIKEKSLGEAPAKVFRTVEKPAPENAPSQYAIVGRYVFEPVIFEYLKKTSPGAGGEIQLTDAMTQLCDREGLYALQLKGCRYDIGNPLFYVKAQVDEALRRPELAPHLREYLKRL